MTRFSLLLMPSTAPANPDHDTLLRNQDNGPEGHSRRTQFMARFVEMADTSNMTLSLAYYPPYHAQ